jgi:hypothetical protein
MLYVAPPELGRFGYSNVINMTRLWRSSSKTLIPMIFNLHTPHLTVSPLHCRELQFEAEYLPK